jgi:uncharacterized protein (DUF427 family)
MRVMQTVHVVCYLTHLKEITMGESPGHRQFPQHQIREQRVEQRVTVTVDGRRFADSMDVIRVDEDEHRARYYFARADVPMHKLEPSATTSQCPFKGTARYFNVLLGDRKIVDAVWSYEDPYDEHRALKDRLAFYDDKFPEIRIEVQA